MNLQQQVADLSKRLTTEFGFQGVFMDAEPVWDDDQDFLALLRAFAQRLASICRSAPPFRPIGVLPTPRFRCRPLMEPNTEWKKEYKQSVALLVDHMVVMVFNSTLPSASDYSQWVAYQVKAFALAIG